MRPPRVIGPSRLYFLFFLLTLVIYADSQTQTNLLCKQRGTQNCLLWRFNLDTDDRISNNNYTPTNILHNCGLSYKRSVSPRGKLIKVRQILKKGQLKKIFCKKLLLVGRFLDWKEVENTLDISTRVRRQSFTPRGRYRGQTQSQYLAIDRGNGKDIGRAEAQSAADSSRAIVSGNSGMGQAQSQSLYDSSCDDCYGKTNHEIENLKRPIGSKTGDNGYAPDTGSKWPTLTQNGGYNPTDGQPYMPRQNSPGALGSVQEPVLHGQNGKPGDGNTQSSSTGPFGPGPIGTNNYRPNGAKNNGYYPNGYGGNFRPSETSENNAYGPTGSSDGRLPNSYKPNNNNIENRYRPPGDFGPDWTPGTGGYRGSSPEVSSGSRPDEPNERTNYKPSIDTNRFRPTESHGGQYIPNMNPQTYRGQDENNYLPNQGEQQGNIQSSPGNFIPQNGSYKPGQMYNQIPPSEPNGSKKPGTGYNPRQEDVNFAPGSGNGVSGTAYNPDARTTGNPVGFGTGQTGTPNTNWPTASGPYQVPGGNMYCCVIPNNGLIGNMYPNNYEAGKGNPNVSGGQYGSPGQTYGTTMPGIIGVSNIPGEPYRPDGAHGSSVPGGHYGPGTNGISSVPSQYQPGSTGGHLAPGGLYGVGGSNHPNGQYIPTSTGNNFIPSGQYGPKGIVGSIAPGGQFIPGSTEVTNVPRNQYGPGGTSSTYEPGTKYGPGGVSDTSAPGGQYGPVSGNRYGPVDDGGTSRGQYGPKVDSGSSVPGQYGPSSGSGSSLPGGQYRPSVGSGSSIPGGQYGPSSGSGSSVPGGQFGPISGSGTSVPGHYDPNVGSGSSVPGSQYGPGGGSNSFAPGSQYRPSVDNGSSVPGAQFRPSTGSGTSVPGGQYGPVVGSGSSVPGGHYGPSSGSGTSVPGGPYGPSSGSGTTMPGGKYGPGVDSISSVPRGQYGPSTGSGTSVPGGQYGPVIGSGSSVPGGQYGPSSGSGTSVPGGQYGPGASSGSSVPSGEYGPSSGRGTSLPGNRYGPDVNSGSAPGGQYGPRVDSGSSVPGNQYGPSSGSGTLFPGGQYIPGGGSGSSVPKEQYIPNDMRGSGQYIPGNQDIAHGGSGDTTGPGGQNSPDATINHFSPGGQYSPGGTYSGGQPGTNPQGFYNRGGSTGQNVDYNGVPQNYLDPNTVAADGDDSEAEANVAQSVNGTTASATSKGGNNKGRAQTSVQGTYTGSGSFQAQAQITGENKEAQSEVSGGKKGASSSATGSGSNNKSQAKVQLGSETGSVQTQSQSNGVMHSSNSQVQGSVKGGTADAQARGPGSTSSQAQIGFTPYKDEEKSTHDLQRIPFAGGGMASAQSKGRTGQSQSQLHGTFKYGLTYNGAAQSGASLDKDAVFPNRLSFEKIDVFDEKDKNIDVDKIYLDSTETPQSLDYDSTPLESSTLSESSVIKEKGEIPTTENSIDESMKNSESRHSGHAKIDRHKPDSSNTSYSNVPTLIGSRRSFKTSDGSMPDYEFTTDKEETQPEYDVGYEGDVNEASDVEQNEYSNYDEYSRDSPTHQYLQNSNRKGLEVQQTTGGNTQHIILGSLKDHNAEIIQKDTERPDETRVYQPGERVPGTGGYTIPVGFTGSVKSVASKDKTYVVGSKDFPSQAQTVTLTPGKGKVKYTPPTSYGKYVKPKNLRSLQTSKENDDRYVSVSKSVTRALDSDNNIRKQYSHTYYTKSSSCGYFTFTCTMVSSAEGRKKVCRPKMPTNPDGTPIRC